MKLWLVVGNAGTYRSSDGGATWRQQAGPSGGATAYPTALFVAGDSLWLTSNGL